MFEAAICSAIEGVEVPAPLRPLEWGEIVARLAAGRDLRAIFARASTQAASFAAHAEGGLERIVKGEPDVNLADLVGGKTTETKRVATAEIAAVSDQGTR